MKFSFYVKRKIIITCHMHRRGIHLKALLSVSGKAKNLFCFSPQQLICPQLVTAITTPLPSLTHSARRSASAVFAPKMLYMHQRQHSLVPPLAPSPHLSRSQEHVRPHCRAGSRSRGERGTHASGSVRMQICSAGNQNAAEGFRSRQTRLFIAERQLCGSADNCRDGDKDGEGGLTHDSADGTGSHRSPHLCKLRTCSFAAETLEWIISGD